MKATGHRRTSGSVRWIVALALPAAPLPMAGQVSDAGVWSSVTIETELLKDVTASLQSELRLEENASRVGSVFHDAGAEFKFSQRLRVSANYRFIRNRQLEDYYESRHRYYFDLTYRHKVNKKLDLRLRTRWQTQYSGFYSSETGPVAQRYVRMKVSARYDLPKGFDLSAGMEVFIPTAGPGGTAPDGLRFGTGFGRRMGKAGEMELFWLADREITAAGPKTSLIAGIGYKLALDALIRKEKDNTGDP